MDQSNFVRECDENWTLIGEKFCVKIEQNLLTWSESLSACSESGGVNLELENEQIEGLMRAFLDEDQSSQGQGSAVGIFAASCRTLLRLLAWNFRSRKCGK